MAAPKTKKLKSAPTTVADFIVLPLALPSLLGLPPSCDDAKHYVYVRAHAPSIATESSARSLFIANVPVDASETNIRALFAEQLGGARVEGVDFDSSIPAVVEHKRFKSNEKSGGTGESRGKKRKRGEADIVAEGVVEDEESALPRIWNGELRRSGACAVVTFVDKGSMRGALKEVSTAVKERRNITWPGGETLGVERYKSHASLLYPAPSGLQSTTNAYLAQFDRAHAQRSRQLAHLRNVPDEDGFITVTRGGGRSAPAARLEIAEKQKSEHEDRKKKKGELNGFYRFQNREKRKEEEGRLRRQFEKDRRRVVEMRERRGKVRLES
ncbi:hypothetical protein N0V90_009225 [Kalmusia sp. IMI 367209]|nr:hypothetical protein N0V90_009225 [Kalmusia sp. IMI 367209]